MADPRKAIMCRRSEAERYQTMGYKVDLEPTQPARSDWDTQALTTTLILIMAVLVILAGVFHG